MSYVLGIDAGNTKTVAVVASCDGTIRGWGRSGCADIYAAGSPQAALAAVEQSVTAALGEAGIGFADISDSVFSMAGADWPEDYKLLQSAIDGKGWSRRALVVNDALGGLRAGSPSGIGVSVISGTYAAIGAKGSSGKQWHGSFWVQDAGGKDMSREALNAVLRGELGAAPPTAMRDLFLEMTGETSVERMLHAFTRRESQRRPSTRDMLSVLFRSSDAGDAEACRIVADYGRIYSRFVVAAAGKVDFHPNDRFPMVMGGGVLRHAPAGMIAVITDDVRSAFPHVQPVTEGLQPVMGALYWALENAGVPVTDEVVATIGRTLPEESFFSTV